MSQCYEWDHRRDLPFPLFNTQVNATIRLPFRANEFLLDTPLCVPLRGSSRRLGLKEDGTLISFERGIKYWYIRRAKKTRLGNYLWSHKSLRRALTARTSPSLITRVELICKCTALSTCPVEGSTACPYAYFIFNRLEFPRMSSWMSMQFPSREWLQLQLSIFNMHPTCATHRA